MNNNELVKENLTFISAYTSKLLREIFGRGPQHCHCNFSLPFLVLYIRGFKSDMENALVFSNATEEAYSSRFKLINDYMYKLTNKVEDVFNLYINESFHDWDYQSDTGVIVFTFLEDNDGLGEVFPKARYLKSEMEKVSDTKEKLPDSSQVYQVTDQIYIAQRRGILTEVEKAMIKEGYYPELHKIKKDLEKKFFTRKVNYSKVFGRSLRKIYISLNLMEDKSYICFFLNKAE